MYRCVRYLAGLLAFALVHVLAACTVAYEDDEGEGTRIRVGSADSPEPLRFAVARFQHETCTFCPGGDTDVDDWLRVSEPLSGEALLSSGGYVGGFVKRAREFAMVRTSGSGGGSGRAESLAPEHLQAVPRHGVAPPVITSPATGSLQSASPTQRDIRK